MILLVVGVEMLLPMQEIFILLEDEKEVPLFRLNRWGRKTRGVLAKLKKYSWAEKIIKNDEVHYKITEKGEKEIDRILIPLKKQNKWDGKWRLVIFDVPESKRAIRDKLRRALIKLGLGILQASVWISPSDIKDEVINIGKKLNLGTSLKIFEVTRSSNFDKTILEKAWNLPEISDAYSKFIFETERFLNIISKISNPRYSAKKLIFEYALITQKDPVLPNEFREQDPTRKKAYQNYLKLREYVV